jgi:hypothetical protein
VNFIADYILSEDCRCCHGANLRDRKMALWPTLFTGSSRYPEHEISKGNVSQQLPLGDQFTQTSNISF